MPRSNFRSHFLSALCGFVSLVTISQRLSITPNEILSLVLFVCLYQLFRYAFHVQGRRRHISSAVLALFFSLFSILARLDLYGAQSTAHLSALFHTLGLTLIYHAFLIILISGLDKQSFLMNAEDCTFCGCPTHIHIWVGRAKGSVIFSFPGQCCLLSFFSGFPMNFPGGLPPIPLGS